MKYRRWIAKVAVALMVIGIGSAAAVIPASSASAAACSLTTSVSQPYKISTSVYARYTIEVSGCGDRYWTEYSYLNGPRSTGRTESYRGDRYYSFVFRVSSCRTGTYKAILQIIGEGFDSYDEESKYIRC
jgi:hypothetical protein